MIKHNVSLFRSIPPAFIFWKDNFLKIATVAIIVAIPMQLTIELASYFLNNLIEGNSLEKTRFMNSVYNFIRGLYWPIALLGIINFTFKHLSGREEERSVLSILLFGLFKWPKYLLATLIAFFKILLYTLALIIPGIYKGVRLSFVDCIVATKDIGVVATCDKSELLVKNNWWRIFGFGIMLFIFEMLIEATIFAPALFVGDSPFLIFILAIITRGIISYLVVLRATYYFEVDKIHNAELIAVEADETSPHEESSPVIAELNE